jgi:hypothetical protein
MPKSYHEKPEHEGRQKHPGQCGQEKIASRVWLQIVVHGEILNFDPKIQETEVGQGEANLHIGQV